MSPLHAPLNIFAALAQEEEHAAETAAHVPAPPAELLFYLFDNHALPVTNTLLTSWIVMIVLVVFAFLSTRNMKMAPSGFQNFWELIIELWVGVSERTMGRRRGRRFLPLVTTAFLFIIFSNWLGILPVVGPVTVVNAEHHVVPLFRSANSDLNLTAGMAVMMIVLAEFFELRSMGVGGYFKGLVLPNPMRWLEIFTRPISLSLRLFGNIFAGEVLLATMITVAPFVLFVFLGLELFVGLIQALIFSMLSLVFLSIATVHEEAEHHVPGEHSLESELAKETHGQPI